VSDHLETERKYDADADFVLPDLGGLPGVAAAAPPERYHLSATYYDTEDLALIGSKVTLRRRTGGTDEGWHLKLPVRQDTRQEVHAPLGESAEAVPARLAAEVEDITAGRPLRPIAQLDTERTVVTLTGLSGEGQAEVADDLVTARRLDQPGSSGPLRWREIEVEALSQDPGVRGVLEAAGEALREAGARRSSSGSKLGRLLGR
jgi:inorganic triphosphatase YgiF